MKYEVGKETIFNPDTYIEVDPVVSEFLFLLTSLVNYDFSKLMITNVYDLNILMNSPENYIQDKNVCKKVKSLKHLMELWEE